MKRITIALIGFIVALTGLWLLADTLPASTAGITFGAAFTQLTGILSIGMMSFATLMSIRPKWLEPTFDGLDKMYRLHKWLGIGGMAVGIVHWLTASGGGRGRPGAAVAGAAQGAAASAQNWLDTFHGPARGVGQPALFLLIALVAIALIKWIPYRFFAKTHILVAIAFLALAFHSVVLMKAAYWSQPIGWASAFIVLVGVVSALGSVLRRLGLRQQTNATVLSSTYYPELRVLETTLSVGDTWPGHEAGQFAFVTTDKWEGAHPYTIASAWHPQEKTIRFIAKELGDHTAKLRETFTPGKPAWLEGPHGRFAFDDGKLRQIWISAGIGITPFIAKMRERAMVAEEAVIDLFHTTADVSETALAKMRQDAAEANVRLHITVSSKDGKLNGEKIRALAPDWKEASVWFCGPAGFGGALRRDFTAAGLHAGDFHQELFQMR